MFFAAQYMKKYNLQEEHRTMRELLKHEIGGFAENMEDFCIESAAEIRKRLLLSDAGRDERSRAARLLALFYFELYEPVRFDPSFIPDAGRLKEYINSLSSLMQEVS